MQKILLILLLLINLCSCSNGQRIKESSLLGVKTYVYEEYNMPQELGKPHLTEEEVVEYSSIDSNVIIDEIDSYIDILRINETRNYSNKFSNDVLCMWASKHFDNVGIIHTEYINEYNKKIIGKLIFIETENNIYVLNINQDSSNKEYLKYFKSDNAVFNDKDELYHAISDYYPINYWLIEVVDNTILLPNGEISYITMSRNTECYEYKGYKLPVGLGMPELNDSEIEALTKTTDYKKIEDSINNIGDAVAYIKALNIRVQGDNEGRSFKGGTSVDYGNIFYDNQPGVVYACSGPEIIKLRVAQCSAMATLINFLLYNDYLELGYVTGRGHAVNYAKGKDNRYYLIDASEIIDVNCDEWLLHHTSDGNADTLDELMIDYCEHPVTGLDDYRKENDFLISWVYDGVWSYKQQLCDIEQALFNKEVFLLPVNSTKANIWKKNYDNTEISYYEPVNSTSHYHFIFEE